MIDAHTLRHLIINRERQTESRGMKMEKAFEREKGFLQSTSPDKNVISLPCLCLYKKEKSTRKGHSENSNGICEFCVVTRLLLASE